MYEFVNTQQPQPGKSNKGSFVSSVGDESIVNSSKPQKGGLNNTMNTMSKGSLAYNNDD